MSETPSHNMRFYAPSAEPPKDALKSFTRAGGFSGTDINSMWRIKMLTELFGPCGIGWWTEEVEKTLVEYTSPKGQLLCKCFMTIDLYYIDPGTGKASRPIRGYGGNDWIKLNKNGERVSNDEMYAMAETDAIGKACKKLGIGAKVYWSTDKTKYTIEEDDLQDPEEANTADNVDDEAAKTEMEANYAKEKAFEDKANFKKAAECRKAVNDWVSEDPLVNAGHEVLASYCERFGTIDQWNAGTCIQCYKELRDAKVQGLKEVAL